MKARWSSFLRFTLLLTLALPVRGASSQPPNLVLIMADDFGYECVGANGSTSYQTPHLDRLAATGMRFERCFVQPLCTPTRVQLMTGLYNVRNYRQFGELDRQATTFAQLLKQAGYVTGIAGKWQLGRDASLPKHFGFEESCLWQHTRRPPRYANPGLEYNGEEKDFSHGEYGPDLVNQFARDFIQRHQSGPFFLYYPMILTHAPFQPTPDSPTWDPHAQGERVNQDPKHFAHMVAYLDKLIGQLVQQLDDLSLRQQTLVLFLGDNGSPAGSTSELNGRPFRGGKGSPTAAGMHVPLIANWPGTIPGGRTCRDLIDSTDFLPTLCEAAGASLPAQLILDGRSFLPQLRGQPGQPRDWVYCWYARNGGPKAQHEFAMDTRYKLRRNGQVFDLLADPLEKKPLASSNLPAEAAAAVDRLQKVLDQYAAARPAVLRQASPASQP